MGRQLDIESLNILIKAVQDYQKNLDDNKKILENAASVCDQAMGSDAISKKHIDRLNETLKMLKKTSDIAEDVAKKLIADRNHALEVYENS